MKTLIFAIVLANSPSSFAQKASDFMPAFASEQKIITAESLKEEASQFKSLSRWKIASDQLTFAEQKRDQFKLDFERAKTLVGNGQGSELQVEQAELAFRNAEENVNRVVSDVQKEKADTIVHKLRILEDGNPGDDHRKEMILAMLESLTLENQSLEANLQSSIFTEEYFLKRLKAGEYLHSRGVISLVELERRRLDLQSGIDRVQSIRHQIDAIKSSVHGLQKSLKKL